jgi:hypothetical protein
MDNKLVIWPSRNQTAIPYEKKMEFSGTSWAKRIALADPYEWKNGGWRAVKDYEILIHFLSGGQKYGRCSPACL